MIIWFTPISLDFTGMLSPLHKCSRYFKKTRLMSCRALTPWPVALHKAPKLPGEINQELVFGFNIKDKINSILIIYKVLMRHKSHLAALDAEGKQV